LFKNKDGQLVNERDQHIDAQNDNEGAQIVVRGKNDGDSQKWTILYEEDAKKEGGGDGDGGPVKPAPGDGDGEDSGF
jgi:hypothetical protein